MVYIRSKKVKGIDYAYLVKSVWDKTNNTSTQHTIKYLGKASTITVEDIPMEHRQDPKILAFIASYSKNRHEKEQMITRMQQEIFRLLTECNLSELVKIYDRYSKLLGLTAFYDELLKPVMYEVGDLWAQGKIDAATEHVCSNIANGLIKVINERTANPTKPNLQCKLLICTPEGELHNLGCNVIESFLLSKGFKVYNASPSVPADSIIRYIKDLQPDIILVSITLNENIKPARRLIRKIRSSSHIPVVAGGAAMKDLYADSTIDAIITRNGSLADLVNLINMAIKNS
jgi:MerR family transcriptional regulator, light-induced transcriptional regulator